MSKTRSVGGAGGVAGPRNPEDLSASDQRAILAIIANEKKALGIPSTKKAGTPSKAAGDGQIRPMYIAPGPIVAKYMVVPPWAGIDAHQALINKVERNGIMGVREAQLVRKIFNRDIAEADKEGRDIRPQVAKYLHKVLDKLKASDKANNLVFGPGGPGAGRPQPIYILPPRPPRPEPIYILPPRPRR